MADDAARLSFDSTMNSSEMDEQTPHYSASNPGPPIHHPPATYEHYHEDMGNTPNTAKRSYATAMSGDDEDGTPSASAAPAAKQPRRRRDPTLSQGGNPAIYSGNKVKHLKKDDGEPLWRRDIQYDFLRGVFDDPQKVFTNSYEPEREKQTFADLYIDTMARSSKTSKILKDKLLTEHTPAKNMAMVCLLVNLGRMNTTLNFFPEMRAQLRTYHAIPSLQAHQDPNSYKQLQDAPRLKSILKGASEDRPEPGTLDKIKETTLHGPRTNPVNLIFVLALYSMKVTELHFPPGRDFYDLIMGEDISSRTRARAFLWLMWFYLESDFTEEGAEENPFGEGVDYETDVRNQGVPRFEFLDGHQLLLENVDTEEEREYGIAKMRERKRIIEADQAAFQAEVAGPPKRGPKPKLHLPAEEGSPASFVGRMRPKFEDTGSPATMIDRIRPKYESDMDSTRSTPPPRMLGGMQTQRILNHGLQGRGSLLQNRGGLRHPIMEGSSPMTHLADSVPRRSRGKLTAHQLAVERNRNQRVDYILSRGLRKVHHEAKKGRKRDGPLFRAMQRTRVMPDPFDDSEDEESLMKDPGPLRERGFGGLIQEHREQDDYGEEIAAYAAAFRRMNRRLNRWDGAVAHGYVLGIIGTKRIQRPEPASGDSDGDETDEEKKSQFMNHHQQQPHMPPNHQLSREVPAHGGAEELEDLDDMEKEILGLGSEVEEDEVEEDLDDVDKVLLGLRGDESDDEGSESEAP